MDKLQKYFDRLWANYISMTPQALAIKELFENNGETIVNDHIALRTFNHPKVNIIKLATYFTKYGYVKKGEYKFEEKKLFAIHLEHQNPLMPKVFISELLLEEFSTEFQKTCSEIIDGIDEALIESEDFLMSGRTWDISYSNYEKLLKESEYGAWMSAIGYRPNHFTISVNHLKNLSDLTELNKFLKENGFSLNESGGEIKGSKEVCLEQSSTLADKIQVKFSDKTTEIPSWYFEFAKRYEDETGKLYQGFVAKSADKIFESTN